MTRGYFLAAALYVVLKNLKNNIFFHRLLVLILITGFFASAYVWRSEIVKCKEKNKALIKLSNLK